MDIQTTLREISASGMSDAEIGIAIGAPQSIVTRLRNGNHKTTNWERGQAIAGLHAKRCPPAPVQPAPGAEKAA